MELENNEILPVDGVLVGLTAEEIASILIKD